MRKLLSIQISGLFLLAACGGSSVKFEERSMNNVRIPPQMLLQKLEQSTEAAERTRILTALVREDAYRFDWPLFWDELAQRPFAREIYSTHSGILNDLAIQHCDAFSEYTRYLLAIDADLTPIVSEKRACNNPLHPTIAMQVVRRLAKNDNDASNKLNLAFLTKEAMASNLRDLWTRELQDAEPVLEKLGRSLMASSQRDAYFDQVVAFRQRFGRNGYPKVFLQDLATRPETLASWITHFPGTEGMELLSAMIDEAARYQPSKIELDNFMGALKTNLTRLDADHFAAGFAESMDLALRLTNAFPLRAQLAALDSLLLDGETALSLMERTQRDIVLQDWLSHYKSERSYDFLQFLALRNDPKKDLYSEQVRKNLELQAGAVENEAKLLRMILGAYLAPNSETGSALVQSACDFMGQVDRDLEVQPISSAAELQTKLEQRLPAGCYQLPPGRDVEVVSTANLTMSFAAILVGADQKVSFKAPQVSLGAVQLRATARLSRLTTTPTPPSANGIVFPMLFMAHLDHPSVFFAEGSHFFIYHYVFREPGAGEAEPQVPAAGVNGSNILLETKTDVLAFPFASEGGLGQPGALPRSGGLGDSSFIDYPILSAWVRNRVDMQLLNVFGIMKMQDGLSIERADDLLKNATKVGTAVQLYTIPEYVEQMPSNQRTKILVACRKILNKLNPTRNEVDKCLNENIAPNAIKQLDEKIRKSAADGSLDRTSVLESLDPYADFRVSAAAPGPVNPDGARGKPGQVITRKY